MKILTDNYSIREIYSSVDEKYFSFTHSKTSPEMSDEDFEFLKNSILDGFFQDYFPIYTIEIKGRINFYHSSSLMSKIINFLRSKEFNNLEPFQKNIFYRYKFKICYLIQYETEQEAINYLDRLQEIKKY